jgi:hypothetical protein
VQGVGGPHPPLEGGDVPDGGGRDDGHPVPGAADPQAQVHVLADQGQCGVEPADVVEHAAADEHARGRHHQDVAARVVLALVDVAGDDVGEPTATR